jgi:peroxiredoxin
MVCRTFSEFRGFYQKNKEAGVKISREKAVLAAVLMVAFSWGLTSCEKTTSAVSYSGRTADFTLKNTDGEDYNFYENTEGKVVILNFWAQRCPACKVEIPNLVDLYEAYGEDGLEVIGIDVDGSGISAMKAARDRYGINYPLLTGNARDLGNIVSGLGGFRFIPTTYIIGRDGKVADKVSGPKGKEYLETSIRELL